MIHRITGLCAYSAQRRCTYASQRGRASLRNLHACYNQGKPAGRRLEIPQRLEFAIWLSKQNCTPNVAKERRARGELAQ